jgi:tetratricopeptide (TPR) repeat protein
MKKVFCLLILHLISHFVPGQNRIDSLKNKLQDVKSGPERASILADICIAYRLTAADSAVVYGDSAISLARKINYPFAEYKALAGKSWAYHTLGNIPFSMTNAYKALDIGRNIKMDKTYFAMAYNAIGGGYRTLKQYDKALEFYYREIFLACWDLPSPI